MSDMTAPNDTQTALDFRIGPNGEFALRVGDVDTAEWLVGRFQGAFQPTTDETVEDWFRLVPAELVGMLAHRVQADLAKVETAASRLGDVHDEVVQELRDKVDVLDRQVQAMRDFATELSSEPLAGRYFASEINRRLDEAAEE